MMNNGASLLTIIALNLLYSMQVVGGDAAIPMPLRRVNCYQMYKFVDQSLQSTMPNWMCENYQCIHIVFEEPGCKTFNDGDYPGYVSEMKNCGTGWKDGDVKKCNFALAPCKVKECHVCQGDWCNGPTPPPSLALPPPFPPHHGPLHPHWTLPPGWQRITPFLTPPPPPTPSVEHLAPLADNPDPAAHSPSSNKSHTPTKSTGKNGAGTTNLAGLPFGTTIFGIFFILHLLMMI